MGLAQDSPDYYTSEDALNEFDQTNRSKPKPSRQRLAVSKLRRPPFQVQFVWVGRRRQQDDITTSATTII